MAQKIIYKVRFVKEFWYEKGEGGVITPEDAVDRAVMECNEEGAYHGFNRSAFEVEESTVAY